MKLQEQGLISLEWLDKKIEEYANYDEAWLISVHAPKVRLLEQVKKQLISPIPLAEKIWDESKCSWVKEKNNHSDSELWFKEHKQTFLNSDIKIN